MKRNPVVFIAFLEQDNLGVGYIASTLLKNKIDIKIVDFRLGKERILEQLLRYDPLVVGFSVIFQYHICEFKELVAFLRTQGLDCHFSAGGHYPSLRYGQLLNVIPELDSVVLYEGEHTFLELVQALHAEREWRDIQGIAHHENGAVVANALRPLEEDLDHFPPPVRQPLKEYALGKKYATLLAGRGCYYACAFCSIRQFYSTPPGPVKRVRRPGMVVREMELLHEQLDCSVFMFQDDDFPVIGDKGQEWTRSFCELLLQRGHSERWMWKMNCRPDEIRADLFEMMRDAGLFLVYLGIEDGTEDGLRLMNKRMTPETSIEAVHTLKRLGVEYDFGFMLFNPDSTFDSVASNLDFLGHICGDGSAPITFCKMLPYAETRIEHRLKGEGRLKGEPGFEDYDFIDPRLNHLHACMTECFRDWIGGHEGVLNLARWARCYYAVYRRHYPMSSAFRELEQALTDCIAHSNRYFLDAAQELVRLFNSRDYGQVDNSRLRELQSDITHKHWGYKVELTQAINDVQKLSR